MRHTLSLLATRSLAIAAGSWVSLAIAQTNLGAALDAGGRQITADEFKRDVVGKVIRGSGTRGGSVSGASAELGSLELVYLGAGSIQGVASSNPFSGRFSPGAKSNIEGSWSIDDRDRVCTSIRMGGVVLAPRCQFWYVRDKTYFISDSDSDRSARITSYTIQP